MSENSAGSPVFAGRYRFQPIGNDWDRGRSGFTSLIYDETDGQLRVIKRAETASKRLTEGLNNEERSLRALKGLGVPNVYDKNHAIYESTGYDYMVIEYIDGIRVEKSLDSLGIVERADIITQFFGLLAQAHQKGIVNGDVDLKHLFWRNGTGKKQLVVIDWGNAKLGVDTRKKTEFAYDLARSAEIIFSLVTYQGIPPATGSIALPDTLGIIAGLEPLPKEFRELCAWAPRTPSDGAQAPYTAKEMLEVSKAWLKAIQNAKAFKQHQRKKRMGIFGTGISIIAVVAALLWSLPKLFSFLPASVTASNTSTAMSFITPSADSTDAPVLTKTTLPTITSTESATLVPSETLPPNAYSSLLIFDKNLKLEKDCWKNEAISNSELLTIPNDGFYRRTDGNWGFKVDLKYSVNEIVQVDFRECFDSQRINAFALNVMVHRLDQHKNEPSREFGVFSENQSGQRREYTLWLDDSGMFLRIRENNNEPMDYPIKVINPANIKRREKFPRTYSSFSIMLFLDLNNQGSDIIYLLEGTLGKPANFEDIDPTRMFPIETRPTLGNLRKVGLVGRGGQTETLIWPLVLLERKTK